MPESHILSTAERQRLMHLVVDLDECVEGLPHHAAVRVRGAACAIRAVLHDPVRQEVPGQLELPTQSFRVDL